MIYEVKARLYFTEPDEASDFYHDCVLAYMKSIICNPDTDAAEYGIIELIENHHDEDPNASCSIISSDTNEPIPPV